MQSNIALTMKTIELAAGYAEGKLDVAMDRLPGQSADLGLGPCRSGTCQPAHDRWQDGGRRMARRTGSANDPRR